MTTNRPTGDDWTPRSDWRNFLATLISMVVYAVPWFVFQWRWPTFIRPGEQELPPVPVTLAWGVGWIVAAVVLLAVVVPSVLASAGRLELAFRWRSGAIHAAWFGVIVSTVSAGIRLPLSPLLRMIATVALVVAELLAVRWLARRGRDPIGPSAPPSG